MMKDNAAKACLRQMTLKHHYLISVVEY